MLMTEENLLELKTCLYELENSELPKVQAEVSNAAQGGDLRENQAYEVAMDALKILIAKIEEYHRAVNETEIEKYNPNSNALQLDDWVELIDSKGNVYIRKLVGISPILGDSSKGEMSIDSPVGKSIYGKLRGTTSVVINKDVIEYKFRKIGHGEKPDEDYKNDTGK